MPSIQDIANKTKDRMFKKADTRHLEEVLPSVVNNPKDQNIEPIIKHRTEDSVGSFKGSLPEKTKHSSSNFVKVDYRPWDDDKPIDKSTIVKNSPGRIIISLYGVQRSVVKFLIEHIDYEEGQYVYTLPIDVRSIVMFTNSSKFTVDTSIRRLKEKGVIESWDHKRGRGGYVTFRILNKLRDEFLNSKNKPVQPIMK